MLSTWLFFFSKNFHSEASSWWQRSTWNYYFFQKKFFLRHPPDGNRPNFRSQKQIAFPSNLPLGCNKFCEQQEWFRLVRASQILLQYPLRSLPRYNAIHSPKLLLYDTTISKDRKDFFCVTTAQCFGIKTSFPKLNGGHALLVHIVSFVQNFVQWQGGGLVWLPRCYHSKKR